jgi:shikimate kinase
MLQPITIFIFSFSFVVLIYAIAQVYKYAKKQRAKKLLNYNNAKIAEILRTQKGFYSEGALLILDENKAQEIYIKSVNELLTTALDKEYYEKAAVIANHLKKHTK